MLSRLINRRTLIIGSALAGAFVLGAIFEHLRPNLWRSRLSPEEKAYVADIEDIIARKTILPRVLARCMAAGIAVPEVPSDPFDHDGDRRSYVIACMRGEDFEYNVLGKTLGGDFCDAGGYHGGYRWEQCYRRASP